MLEAKAIRGIPWTMFSYGANRLVTLATVVVLARILDPADFGLLALAVLVVGLLSLFSGLGLGGALVLRQDLDRRAQGTILTLLLATGVVFAALLAALSPLASDLFDEPRLTDVLLVLSLLVLVSGFNWFYETLLQRELEFSRRFAAVMAQATVNAAVAILLAILGAGIWSLVGGQIAGTLVYGASLVALAPYRVRPGFDREVARDVLSTGRGFLFQGGAAFISQNVDYIAVGRSLGAAPLGFYSMAYRLSEIPYWGIADPIAKVTFPGFARMRHRGEDVKVAFLSALRLVALAACPLGVLLSATADPFTRTLFGDRWLAMIGPLSVLGIWTALRSVEATAGWLLNSVGEAGLLAWLSALFLGPLFVSLLLAAHFGGITAVSWVMLANTALATAVVAYFLSRRVGVPVAGQARAVWPIVVACGGAWVTARATVELAENAAPVLALLASGAIGTAAYFAIIFLVQRSLIRDTIGQVRRMRANVSVVADSP